MIRLVCTISERFIGRRTLEVRCRAGLGWNDRVSELNFAEENKVRGDLSALEIGLKWT